MNLQQSLKTWKTDRLCDECLHLLEKKDEDANWRPYVRELMSRVMAQDVKRKAGKPASVQALNLADVEQRIAIQKQQLKGALILNDYLLNQVRTAKGTK
ncbi:hypothetical protein [Corynebacterium sp. HMSC28B08]|uniref:hypothetical protein n=1 Tax=Corynebacterium sp. HMSC28B08 TaxID=1581066 RepID=UPI0008A1EEF6|nr:hypothetical protein [Corynebacterium sp. HMSC28B08]OFT88996.1 hypothetical protein HMPREF3098_06785 [Corynebacterium sp. HMSC28B08]